MNSSHTNHDIHRLQQRMDSSQGSQWTGRSSDAPASGGGAVASGGNERMNTETAPKPLVALPAANVAVDAHLGSGVGQAKDSKDATKCPNKPKDRENSASDPNDDDAPDAVKVTITSEPIYGRAAVEKKARDERKALRLAAARSTPALAMPSYKSNHDSNSLRPEVENTRLILKTMPTPAPIATLQNGSHFIASHIPSAFPPHLTFRALAAYSTLRSLSIQLRLSPFSPNAFLRALSLPCECALLGEIHVSMLKILFAHHELGSYYPRGDGLSKLKLNSLVFGFNLYGSIYNNGSSQHYHASSKKVDDSAGVSDYLARKDSLYKYSGENLLYLNEHTWPLYYMDYASIHHWTKLSEEEEVHVKDETLDASLEEDIANANANSTSSSNLTKAIFKSQPSDIDIRTCYTPYVNFPWMMDGSVLGIDAEQEHDATRKGRSKRGGGGARSGRNRNGNGRSKKRRRKSDDSSDESDAYEPDYDEYDSQSSRMSISNKRKRSSAAATPGQSHSHSQSRPEDVKPPTIKFCESERNPRPVAAQVHDAILNYLEEQKQLGIEGKEEATLKLEGTEEIIGYNGGGRGRDPNHDSNAVNNVVMVTNINKEDEGNGYDNEDEEEEGDGTDIAEKAINEEMEPVHVLSRGKPYYLLKPEMKLQILEYLLDELLDVTVIRDIISTRHNTSLRREPYEKLPTSEELEELVNQDVCSVCYNGGDLICCDGCVSSYHKKCIKISPIHQLAEGKKWFCPECSIVNVCKLGSIDGGLKSTIDWFRLKDLQLSDSDRESPIVSKLYDVQFLIVHGFVFVRHSNMKRPVSVMQLLSQDMPELPGLNEHVNVKNADNLDISVPVPLQPKELFILLKSLGPSICSLWPFAQIPFQPEKLWADTPTINSEQQQLHLSNTTSSFNYRFYTDQAAAFNPYVYVNKYKNAPPTALVVSRRGKHEVIERKDTLLKLHNESFHNSFSRDTSKDIYLTDFLRKENILVNPLMVIYNHLHSLERTFSTASLLHELWGYRNKANDPDWWTEMVSGSKSYKKLAKLLVRLVDDVHPRAFRSEWFVIPGVTRDDFSLVSTDSRVYLDLPRDWTPEKEKRKRKWEQSHVNDILGLVVREQGGTSRKPTRRFKKKKPSEPKSTMNSSQADKFSGAFNSKSDPQTSQPSVRKARRKAQEEIQKRPSTRRSKDARPSRFPQDGDAESVRKARLFDLETSFVGDFEREVHWPIAGRKLFAPSGSLPIPTAKWLGRNAGIKRVPGLRYTDKFEVGLPSVQMIWREKTLSCNSFEGLLYQLEFLDSYLDKVALVSCEKLSSRTGLREHIQKTVMCSRLDQDLGLMEHFVVHKNKWRGCWQNCLSVDSSAFIVFRSTRVKEARAKFSKRKPKTRKDKKTLVGDEQALNILRAEINDRTAVIVTEHTEDVKKLMIECNKRGMSMIPSETINPLRATRCEKIRKIYIRYGVNGTILLSDADVNEMIRKAEENAKESYLSEMKIPLKKEPSIDQVFAVQPPSMSLGGSHSVQLPLSSTQPTSIALGRAGLPRSGAASAQSDRTLVTSNLSTRGIPYQADPLTLITTVPPIGQPRPAPVSQTIRSKIPSASTQLMQQQSIFSGNASLPQNSSINASGISDPYGSSLPSSSSINASGISDSYGSSLPSTDAFGGSLPSSSVNPSNISDPYGSSLPSSSSMNPSSMSDAYGGSLPSSSSMNLSSISNSFPPIPSVESGYASMRSDAVSRQIENVMNTSAQYVSMSSNPSAISRQMDRSFVQNHITNKNVTGATSNSYYKNGIIASDGIQSLPSSSFGNQQQQLDLQSLSNYHNSQSTRYGGIEHVSNQPQLSAYDMPNPYDNSYQATTSSDAYLGAPSFYQNNNQLQSMSLSGHGLISHSSQGQGMPSSYSGQSQYSQLNAPAPAGLYSSTSTNGGYQAPNGYLQQNQYNQMHQNPPSTYPPGAYGGQF